MDAGGVGHVRGHPADVGATLGVRPAGDRDHLVLACESRSSADPTVPDAPKTAILMRAARSMRRWK